MQNVLQNLLDLAHAPFTHTSTFAKGWPVPDVVRFKAEQVALALSCSLHCADLKASRQCNDSKNIK